MHVLSERTSVLFPHLHSILSDHIVHHCGVRCLEAHDNTMTTQIRDTQFGHLVRYLSGKKLFQYPDEIDPSLYTTSLSPRTHRPQSDSADPSDDLSVADEAASKKSNTQRDDVEEADKEQALTDAEATFLVDWYCPDDPEVFPLFDNRQDITHM